MLFLPLLFQYSLVFFENAQADMDLSTVLNPNATVEKVVGENLSGGKKIGIDCQGVVEDLACTNLATAMCPSENADIVDDGTIFDEWKDPKTHTVVPVEEREKKLNDTISKAVGNHLDEFQKTYENLFKQNKFDSKAIQSFIVDLKADTKRSGFVKDCEITPYSAACVSSLSKGMADVTRSVFEQQRDWKQFSAPSLSTSDSIKTEKSSAPQLQNVEETNDIFKNADYQQATWKVREKIHSEVENSPLLKSSTTRAKEVFSNLKLLYLDWIDSKPGIKDKEFLKNRIRSTEFRGFDCEGSSPPVMLSKYNITNVATAYHNDDNNMVTICLGSLAHNPSLFSMIQHMAHEIGHSIDPCRLLGGPFIAPGIEKYKEYKDDQASDYPLTGLIACMREKEATAIAAPPKSSASRPNPVPDPVNGSNAYNAHPICDPSDAINEAIPDWLAGEILPKYQSTYLNKDKTISPKTGILNLARGSCKAIAGRRKSYATAGASQSNQKRKSSGSKGSHGTPDDRFNRNLMTHPEVREILGCKEASPIKFCGIE